jgi:hypothetical protein
MVKLVEGGERQAEPKKKRSGRTAGRDYADSLWVNGVWQGEVGDEGMELWE